jgi:bacterioferritin
MAELDKQRAIHLLNRILEAELAGVVRYTHYSFLVFGHNRIPIVSWLREQATESLTHAQQAGEMITLLGEYPSLAIGPLLDSHQTDIEAIMRESLESEAKALVLYRELLKSVEGRSVILEEYARNMVYAEELHASEVDKMLRRPGDIASFRPSRQSSAA